jgi:acetolactate synthase-1/2/3 large subunit
MPNVGEAMVDVIAEAGVRRLYTVPGESFLEVLDAAERHPALRQLSTRHESGASFMAEADAKLTGIPAVAMATRGPGAANLSIGVHTAHQDSTPMLVLLGDVETPMRYRGAFQEVDLAAFYAPITKASMTAVRGDRLPDMVRHALRLAVSGRPGPVMISLPADLLAEHVPPLDRGARPAISPGPAPAPAEVTQLRALLNQAHSPVVIAGGGVQHGRDELVRFAETYNVGVYAAFRRQDVFPNDHPNYLGHLTVAAPVETLAELRDADLVMVLGCPLDQMTTQHFELPLPTATTVQVDKEPSVLGAVAELDLGIIADPRELISALLSEPTSATERTWANGHAAYLRSATVAESRASDGVDPAVAVRSMWESFPADTVVTSDAGNFSQFLLRYWMHRHPRTQAAPTNGAMGYAVPAGVGAKAAMADRRVVAVVGDGGFLMTGQEIETAVRYGLDLTVVVMRNGLYGTIAMHQAREMGRTAAVEIGTIDPVGYARSLGASGVSVRDDDELDEAMRDAAGRNGVHVVDVMIDPDLITPTGRLSQMFATAPRPAST